LQKPLESGSLNVAANATPGIFHTDAGREVRGGGGIQPDIAIQPTQVSRLVYVLEVSGALTAFASEYVQAHDITDDFDVTPDLLDQLKVYLSARQIQPGVAEWLRDSDLIQSKLKQEIINLKFGVERGDQIEMRRDPVVQRAIQSLSAPLR
jgi:carboxyl-terminal processing protease